MQLARIMAWACAVIVTSNVMALAQNRDSDGDVTSVLVGSIPVDLGSYGFKVYRDSDGDVISITIPQDYVVSSDNDMFLRPLEGGQTIDGSRVFKFDLSGPNPQFFVVEGPTTAYGDDVSAENVVETGAGTAPRAFQLSQTGDRLFLEPVAGGPAIPVQVMDARGQRVNPVAFGLD